MSTSSISRIIGGSDELPLPMRFPRGLDLDQRLIAQPAPARESPPLRMVVIVFLLMVVASVLDNRYGATTSCFLIVSLIMGSLCFFRDRTNFKV